MEFVIHGTVAPDAGPDENFIKVGRLLQMYAWMLDEADRGASKEQRASLHSDFCGYVIRKSVKDIIGYRIDFSTWGKNVRSHLEDCGLKGP